MKTRDFSTQNDLGTKKPFQLKTSQIAEMSHTNHICQGFCKAHLYCITIKTIKIVLKHHQNYILSKKANYIQAVYNAHLFHT